MRFRLFVSLLAASAVSLVLVVGAQSDPAAVPPIAGKFAGGAVFYKDGSISQTQSARLSVPAALDKASVQWNFTAVAPDAAPVCTHHLERTRVVR